MNKPRRKQVRQSAAQHTAGALNADRWRPVWLGATAALFVAAPLIPSEAAPSGVGVGLVFAWFVVLVGSTMTAAARRRLALRFGWTDAAFMVFLVLHTLSALVMAREGQPRQTLNMLWHWIGFGVAFFSVRQHVQTKAESRAMVAVMMALAVCLSSLGYYQYFHKMPQVRRAYAQDPDRALEAAGIEAPAGSVERELFEDRLASTEPLATFTLANSLAGFLSPWMLCAVGMVGLQSSNVRLRRRLVTAGLLTAFLIAGCWLLTKSRTAWLATCVGATVLIVYGRQSGWRPGWKLLSAALSTLAAMTLLAAFVGGLDLLILTESSKSLLYRTQYWQSTLAMIRDYPWLGCGPGNFQQYYTAYKLPQASETVSDPHNLLLEVWATAGTLACAAFVAVFVCFAMQLRRAGRSREETEEPLGSVRAVYWGALTGVPLAFALGLVVQFAPDTAILFVGLPVAAAIVMAWHPWVMAGKLPRAVLISLLTLLLVNLLAAGGISFAGVSLSVWLTMALALNASEGQVAFRQWRKPWIFALPTVCLLGAGMFWYSTFNPVVSLGSHLLRVNRMLAQGQYQSAEQELLAATSIDSLAHRPWRRLAWVRLRMWLDRGDASQEQPFHEAVDELLARNRRSSGIHAECGAWYLQAYRVTGEAEHLEEATRRYRRAVELYPSYNLGRARLAWVLFLAGRREEARDEANEALRIDELNPHREQKLARQKLDDPGPGSGLQPPGTDGRNAEQWMRSLRNDAELSFGL